MANSSNNTTRIDNIARSSNLVVFNEIVRFSNTTNDNDPDEISAIVIPVEEIPPYEIEDNIVLATIIYETMAENSGINISTWQQNIHSKYWNQSRPFDLSNNPIRDTIYFGQTITEIIGFGLQNKAICTFFREKFEG